MPTGISAKLTLLVHRDSTKIGATSTSKPLDIYRAGPFIEVYIDNLMIGKVRKLEPVCAPENLDIAELCIKLPNYTILLTEEELLNIQFDGKITDNQIGATYNRK